MNRERLVELALDLVKGSNGRKFAMSRWYSGPDRLRYDGSDPENVCGTSCCIGGAAVAKYGDRMSVDDIYLMGYHRLARDILGLSSHQADILFSGGIGQPYLFCTDPIKGARAILNLLDGKEPWSDVECKK